jgi:hypothetical protein
MNFHHREHWVVHFLEADCKTVIGPGARYYHFAGLESLRAMILRTEPDAKTLAEFDNCVRSSGVGSIFLELPDDQYQLLKQPPPKPRKCHKP